MHRQNGDEIKEKRAAVQLNTYRKDQAVGTVSERVEWLVAWAAVNLTKIQQAVGTISEREKWLAWEAPAQT
jgi:hypothetical protein